MREGSQVLFGLFRIWWREEKCVISTKSEGKWWCSTRTRRREMNRMRYIRCLTFPRIQAGFLLWACHTFPTLDQSAQAEVFTCCNLFSLNCSFENWSQIARFCIPAWVEATGLLSSPWRRFTSHPRGLSGAEFWRTSEEKKLQEKEAQLPQSTQENHNLHDWESSQTHCL